MTKARPYFEEKTLCQEQLETQKGRIEALHGQIAATKFAYSQALRQLEQISNEIHIRRRGGSEVADIGPREPGVGSEICSTNATEESGSCSSKKVSDFYK